jgi:hypothetical protein
MERTVTNTQISNLTYTKFRKGGVQKVQSREREGPNPEEEESRFGSKGRLSRSEQRIKQIRAEEGNREKAEKKKIR